MGLGWLVSATPLHATDMPDDGRMTPDRCGHAGKTSEVHGGEALDA